MYGILRFLSRFGTIFLFFFLEAVSVYLIVRFNENQGRIYASSANLISGQVLSRYDKVASYFGLRHQVDFLQQEVVRLEQENRRSFFYDYAESDTVLAQVDSTRFIPMYAYVPAEIINNSLSGRKNMLTINRGTAHGVMPSMGVITSNGVMGIVRHSTKHLSSVMSALNTQIRISASIRNKGYFGSLIWTGGDSRYMRMVDVPKHNQVHPGDTVETSGFSSVFPGGILIGTVEKCWVPSGESNYQIEVKLKTDFSRTRQVYVVKNLFRQEFEELEAKQASDE